MDVQQLQMCQIRNKSLIVYTAYTGSRKPQSALQKYIQQKQALMLEVRKERYSGLISDGVKKRLSKAVNLLVASSLKKIVYSKQLGKYINHQISFITLTIPDATTLEARVLNKKMLEPMLKYLRQVHGMRSYVWKVEWQKRGVLHWHITSDCYVDSAELRNKWNKLLTKNGLNTAYFDSKGHVNANSTDVHSVKKVRDLASYLVKYMVKQYQNSKSVGGKIWDCSKNLKTASYYSTEFTGDIENDVYELRDKGITKIYEADRFMVVRFIDVEPVYFMPREVKEAYYRNLLEIREFSPDLFNRKKQKKLQVAPILIQDLAPVKPVYLQTYLFN